MGQRENPVGRDQKHHQESRQNTGEHPEFPIGRRIGRPQGHRNVPDKETPQNKLASIHPIPPGY
jgi:hypothetical protein